MKKGQTIYVFNAGYFQLLKAIKENGVILCEYVKDNGINNLHSIKFGDADKTVKGKYIFSLEKDAKEEAKRQLQLLLDLF